jgi:hypothetical protein
MRGVLLIIICVFLVQWIGQIELLAKEKNPSVTRYMNAVGKHKKKNRKAIPNYTHTKPAEGAHSTTLHVAKQYDVITRQSLKSRYAKKSKGKLLVSYPKPTGPHIVPGQ